MLASASTACGDGRPAPQAGSTTTTAAAVGDRPRQLDLSTVAFADATDAAALEVVARDNRFEAPFVEVRAGTAITFVNEGSNHDVTPAVAGAFTPIPAEAFGEATVRFTRPGDYVYYCSIHGTPRKGMVGAIRVVG